MSLSRIFGAVLAALATTQTPLAHADDGGMFSFSGFATLGLVRTSTDDAQYNIPNQTRGADKSASAEVDSKLAAQVGAKFNSTFSATLQLLSKQNGKGNFTPGVEWAFLKAQLAPSVSVRLGRMGGPFFMVSDFRDVGFANTMLRPPQDVYGQVPVSHFDGADLTYQLPVGSATLTMQALVGKASDVVGRLDVDLNRVRGVNANLEFDNGLTLRLGHIQGRLSVKIGTIDSLVAVLRATPFASVGNELDATDKPSSFTGAGLSWDQGDWVWNAEYTMRRSKSFVTDTKGWYVMGGHRFGSWTPYVTLSQLKHVDSNVTNTVVPLNAQLGQLKATVDYVLEAQIQQQKTLALGTRWDFRRNFALKAQLERVKPDGRGLFSQTQPGFGTTGSTVNVWSVAVDTVF